ncbi:MAG: aromatic amino acid hydroxylase [Candidatus Marinimicrobia bacterium]|nr:aromatic amino acid hydroxylase [Candidatus Neomarinimicrobiota bacterium]
MTWKSIPPHLQKYIVEQDYDRYSAIDHACWRFIMRISRQFFQQTAHPAYLNGLAACGIETDRIPCIEEIDQKLSVFEWGAVCVRGFIPPSAFMELQSLGVLAIAADMRSLEHLTYTPAPDIVHEAAGHAPIIADPGYAAYLKNYGKVASKAIASKEDILLYNAIRELSDIKENPASTLDDIHNAEVLLEDAVANISYISEAAYMSRMNWWTVEYGLIGSLDRPLIYGAGLLSSVSESYNCLTDKVKKLPFSIDCINHSYDITEPQPQLFVTPDFQTLTDVLEEFASTLACRTGGVEGLAKAKQAQTVTAAVMDSGIRVSGVLSNIILDENKQPIYLQYMGPVQLCTQTEQIPGHGGDYHAEGYGTPVGNIVDISQNSESDHKFEDLKYNEEVKISFASGVQVQGTLTRVLKESEVVILLTFDECTVTYGDQILFKPEWGYYDMAAGEKIISVNGGPSDWLSYAPFMDDAVQKNHPSQPLTSGPDNKHDRIDLYRRVREIRESGEHHLEELRKIYKVISKSHHGDWLLNMEILEIVASMTPAPDWRHLLEKELSDRAQGNSDLANTIRRGLDLIHRF